VDDEAEGMIICEPFVIVVFGGGVVVGAGAGANPRF
jgi:hypothetical protein